MNKPKPNFFQSVARGRSVVFVGRMEVLKTLQTVLVQNMIVPTIVIHPGRDVTTILAQWHTEAMQSLGNACLIILRPMLAHGVSIDADRVIWIGDQPKTSDQIAMFMQCMGRVDRVGHPTTQCAYEEHELFRFV